MNAKLRERKTMDATLAEDPATEADTRYADCPLSGMREDLCKGRTAIMAAMTETIDAIDTVRREREHTSGPPLEACKALVSSLSHYSSVTGQMFSDDWFAAIKRLYLDR